MERFKGRKTSEALRKVLGNLFSYNTYYIYENNLDSIPDIPLPVEATLRIVEEDGLTTFRLYVKGELAHVSYVSFNPQSQLRIDEIPMKVNYGECEVCTGGSRTFPRFRRKGLYTYAYSQIYKYLKGEASKVKFTIRSNNTIPQKAQLKLGSLKIGEGKYLKILGGKSWNVKVST
jgi:hypothetical protein